MLLLLQQNLGFAWGSVSTVTVPDVVGQTEASGTTDIEALGLTVSVVTAYSSAVAAGLIISQNPVGGSEVAPGSNVEITVSLGEAAQSASGGWDLYASFEAESRRRRKRLKELEEQEEAERLIQEARDAEISRFLHEQERLDEERNQLARLKELALRYSTQDATTERVQKALVSAQQTPSRATLERLAREIERQNEEEQFLMLLLLTDL